MFNLVPLSVGITIHKKFEIFDVYKGCLKEKFDKYQLCIMSLNTTHYLIYLLNSHLGPIEFGYLVDL